MKEKKHMKNKTKIIETYSLLVLLATLFMSVAFAQISDVNLTVTGTLAAQVQNGVFISNVTKTVSNGAVSDEIKYYGGTNLSTSVKLSSTSTSYVTYQITMYNNSSNKYYFTGVTYDTNAYDNTNITYSLNGIEEYITTIDSKEEITFNITFEYAEGVTVSTTQELNSLLNFSFSNETIESKVGETTCIAPKGITWEKFIQSEYNTYGFYITDDKIYTSNNKQLLYTDATNNTIGQEVKKTDTILETLLYLETPTIALDKETITLEIEEGGTGTETLTATVDNENLELTWEAAEDSGITISGEGNTRTITVSKAVENATVTVSYGIVSKTCSVIVTEKTKISWVDNGDGTFTRNGITVTIGDYVNYIEGNYTHTPDTSKGAGTSTTGGSSTEGWTLATSELTTEDLSWRVLGVNQEGELELISADPTTQKLCLANDEGYVYAEDNLNNFCNDLYGQGSDSKENKVVTGARSLNVDDINNLTNYNPTTYSGYGEEWIYRYPTQEEMDAYKGTENSTRYMQYSTDGGATWKQIANGRNQTFRLPEETTVLSESNPGSRKLIDTYYLYDILSNLTSDDGYTSEKATEISNMITNGTTSYGISQWLASPVVNCTDEYAYFGVRWFSVGVRCIYGYIYNTGYEPYNHEQYCVRPVVTLSSKSDISLTKVEEIWQIKVGPYVALDKETIELEIENGGTATVKLTATVENTEGDLTWEVTEDSGITIEGEGNTRTITATKEVENAIITVRCGKLSSTCSITVTEKRRFDFIYNRRHNILCRKKNDLERMDWYRI